MSPEEPTIDEIRSNSPGFLLSRAAALLGHRIEFELKKVKLSLPEYVVMRLSSAKGNLTQGELADLWAIDRASMVSIVDALEERKFIMRLRNPQDRRSYFIHLTPAGSKLLTRAKRLVGQEQKQFLQPISDSEWDVVRSCLWRLIHAEPRDPENG